MNLVGGIIGCMMMLGYFFYFAVAGVASLGIGCLCLLWPGLWYELVWAILAINKGSQMLGKKIPEKPPTSLAIMQIICIVNMDVTNCVLGIVNLVMLGQDEVKRYFARR
jgi:hypothetical protein